MSSKLSGAFAKQVAKCALDHYKTKIPNKGKPQSKNKEWTLLSVVVMSQSEVLKVVAMGTGTKCIGHSQMIDNGSLINDAHAEIMARRSFISFLYDQIKEAKNNSDSIFVSAEHNRYKLKPDVLFHLYVSISPCGDASIFEIRHDNVSQHVGEKRKNDEESEIPNKKLKTSVTGAKPVTSGYIPKTKTTDEEEKEDFGDGQEIGLVRTKPGRGPRTLSMSCR
jgi:tRNA-specific adenosine deaminase 1